MFSFLKKSKRKIREPSLNKDLIDNIYGILYSFTIERVLKDPCCKLYIINTFSMNFQDLSNSYKDPNNNTVVAVNLYSYFKDTDSEEVYRYLNGLLKYLPNNKVGFKYAHDLTEITQSISFLSGSQNA